MLQADERFESQLAMLRRCEVRSDRVTHFRPVLCFPCSTVLCCMSQTCTSSHASCPKHVLNMSQTCPRHVLYMSYTCPRHVLDMSQTCPRHVLDISQFTLLGAIRGIHVIYLYSSITSWTSVVHVIPLITNTLYRNCLSFNDTIYTLHTYIHYTLMYTIFIYLSLFL